MSRHPPEAGLLTRLAGDTGSRSSADARQHVAMALAALLLLVVPLIGTHFARFGTVAGNQPGSKARTAQSYPSRPPPVEPMRVREVTPDEARHINAAIPFSSAPNPASRPFRFSGAEADLTRAVDCLAAAQYYEAGDDPTGQRAVAQVVLNRLRHPAFPKSVCGVVFQGSERTTGCQFTFTCDGAMAHTPPAAAWDRARALARRMLGGMVEKKIGYATHYHTDWVVPYWSSSLEKITEVHTHLFFRWPGWWGTPGAFLRTVSGQEPTVPLLARISPAHEGMDGMLLPGEIAPQMSTSATDLAAAPQQMSYTQLAGGARMLAASPARDAFIVQLPWDMVSTQYIGIARTLCSGRIKCRVMGWRAGDGVPHAFPIAPASLPKMLFSYIHDADSKLQRLLWNCDVAPQDNPRNCMRERVPVKTVAPPPVPATETP